MNLNLVYYFNLLVVLLLGRVLQKEVLVVLQSSSSCSLSILVFSGTKVPLHVRQQDSETDVFQNSNVSPIRSPNCRHSYLWKMRCSFGTNINFTWYTGNKTPLYYQFHRIYLEVDRCNNSAWTFMIYFINFKLSYHSYQHNTVLQRPHQYQQEHHLFQNIGISFVWVD